MQNIKQVNDVLNNEYFTTNIYNRCKSTIEKYEMIKPGDRVALEIAWDCNTLTLLAFFRKYQKERDYDFAIEYFVEQKGGRVDRLVKEVIESVGITNYHIIDSDYKEELYQSMKASKCNRMALHQNYNHVVKATLMTFIRKKEKKVLSPVVELENQEITMIRPMLMLKDHHILHWINKLGVNVRLSDEITLFGGACILEEGLEEEGLHASSEFHFNVYECV